MSIEQNEEAMEAIKKLHELGYSGEQAAAAMVELQKSEPEPVAPYTEEELDILMMSLARTSGVPIGSGVRFREIILARHAEMLRAMCDNKLLGELERAYEDVYPGPANGNGILAVYALVREHIEASRPVLTNEMIESWYSDWALGDQDDDLEYYIARRAAEFRSPAGTELRASKLELELADLRTKLDAEFSQSKEYFTELSRVNAENERLDGELSRWRTEHACCGSVVELHKKQDEINKLSDLLRRARADQVEKSRELNARLARIKELEAAHSPQIADDSRRPLKVPSEGDISEKAVLESSTAAHNRRFVGGALWAIDWIKKANGAQCW